MNESAGAEIADPTVPRGWIILGLALAAWLLVYAVWQLGASTPLW